MVILLFAFLIGCVCGLRSMTAPAVVAWGAHLGWLHLQGSQLAFFANKISLVVFSLFAVGELIADKLPFIPRQDAARATRRPHRLRRNVRSSLVHFRFRASPLLGAILGGLGGVAGDLRRLLLPPVPEPGRLPDLLLALLEDVVAVGGGFLLVSHF